MVLVAVVEEGLRVVEGLLRVEQARAAPPRPARQLSASGAIRVRRRIR